jgi:uncharacterized protein YqjF (DUF2071 family)
MRWVDLLFAHWPVPAEALRAHLPAGLELDTFEGQAWLGVVPFRMEDVAPRFLPAPPVLGAFPELNVRTYVRPSGIDGRPSGPGGVWFLSLDAASRITVEGARVAFHLPYFRADMSADTEAGWVGYRSRRTDPRGPAAGFDGRYRPVGPAELATPGSLAAFLTDRRGLYAADGLGRLSWTAISHAAWPLQPAEAHIETNTMAAAHGITLPPTAPLLHFVRRLDVKGWWPRRLRPSGGSPGRSR